MNITLSNAEISLLDDYLGTLSEKYIDDITSSTSDDEGWAWRRLLEIANLRSKINEQAGRNLERVEPDDAWEKAINEVRKAWEDDE